MIRLALHAIKQWPTLSKAGKSTELHFSAWLFNHRPEIQCVLAAARASVEAADRLHARRAAEREAEEARRAQIALDEAAARQKHIG